MKRLLLCVAMFGLSAAGCAKLLNFPSTQAATQDAVCSTLRALKNLNALEDTQTIVLQLQMAWAVEEDAGVAVSVVSAGESVTGTTTSSLTTTLAAGSGSSFASVVGQCPDSLTNDATYIEYDKKNHVAHVKAVRAQHAPAVVPARAPSAPAPLAPAQQ